MKISHASEPQNTGRILALACAAALAVALTALLPRPAQANFAAAPAAPVAIAATDALTGDSCWPKMKCGDDCCVYAFE